MMNESAGNIVLKVEIPRNNMTENQEGFWTTTTTVTIAILLSVVMMLTVIGNFMVITIIIKHKKMRSKTNFFFFNLAVADFLVGVFLVPTALATLIKGDWIFGFGTFGRIVCTINGVAMTMCLIVSIHTLMYTSIYKYYGILNPLSNKFTKRKVGIMIAASWLWAIVCAILTVQGLSSVEYKNATTQCGAKYPDITEVKAILHHLLIQITNIFIPIGIIVYTQTRVLWAVKRFSARLTENSQMPERRVLAQRKRVTVTVFIVILTFVMCWIPYHVYAMHVTMVKDKSTISSIANPVAYLFAYFNSACNPIIYGLRNKAFRQGYKEFLPSRLCYSKEFDLKEHLKNGRKMSDLTSKYSTVDLRNKIGNPKEGVFV